MKLRSISALALMGAVALISCSKELDTTRLERPPLTVGEEIYNELCNRVARDENPLDLSGSQTRGTCMYGESLTINSLRLSTLHENRQRLVRALDFLLAPPVGADLNELLKNLIPLYDTGEPQAQTRAVSVLLTEVEKAPEALAALSRFGARVGYRPLELAAGILWPLATYDRFSELLTTTDSLFGVSGVAHQEWKNTLTATQRELANLEVGPPATDLSVAELTQDLLLSTHHDFTDDVERFVVRRDQRGFASPQVLEHGSWDHRFTDDNGDGFADVDSLGQFLDEFGLPNGVQAPFLVALEPDDTMRDARTRLLSGTGELVYQYMDTSTTFGAALLQETRGLVREENASTVLDLIHPAKHLLGPPGVQSYSYSSGESLSFDGFNVSESPLLDLAHLGGYLANTESFYGDMRLAQELIEKNEREIARVVQALHLVNDWADEPQYEGLSTEPNNNFTDDIAEVVAEIASVPGLLESIVDILGSEAIKPLGPYFAKFMRYSDDIPLDPANPNAPPSFNYTQLVDRSLPDTGDNISIFQRFFHLIHDTKDAKVCNKEGAVLTAFGITYPLFGDGYAECELFQIDDMSVWYLQSVLGVAVMDFKDPLVDAISNLGFLLESLSGIDGFTKNPTYQAVNRFVFGDRNEFLNNLIDDPMSGDGFSLSARHPATIFAWEEEAFINAMKPILWKFHEHGREDLYIDLMSAMHLHWASAENDTTQSSDPQQTAYSNKSGFSRFEDLAARALDDADLLNRLGDLIAVARQANVESTTGKAILIDTIRQWTVPEWNTQLKGRNGETTTTKTDGVTLVSELAPIWLAFDALKDLDLAFGDDESARESLSDIIQLLNEQLLQVEEEFGVFQFKNRRGYAMTKVLLQFARERFDAHREAGDMDSWTSGLTGRTESTLAHPITAALVAMVDRIVQNPEARQELESFLGYLFDELSPNDAFSVTVTSLMDMVQMMAKNDEVVPFVNAASVAFDPENGAFRRILDFIGKANPYDTTGAAPEFLKRLVSPSLSGWETPLEVIIDVGGQVNRLDVGGVTPWSAEDIRHILFSTREFLEDDSRGLERMYQLIENR